jgi:hypothetical protein
LYDLREPVFALRVDCSSKSNLGSTRQLDADHARCLAVDPAVYGSPRYIECRHRIVEQRELARQQAAAASTALMPLGFGMMAASGTPPPQPPGNHVCVSDIPGTARIIAASFAEGCRQLFAAAAIKKIARTGGVSFLRFRFCITGGAGVSYASFGFPAGSGNFFLFSLNRRAALDTRCAPELLTEAQSLDREMLLVMRQVIVEDLAREDGSSPAGASSRMPLQKARRGVGRLSAAH